MTAGSSSGSSPCTLTMRLHGSVAASSARRSVADGCDGEVSSAAPPKRSTARAMRASSVATTTPSIERASEARRYTCSIIGRPLMSRRAFPGSRVDWYRAGIIARTEDSVSVNGKRVTGTAGTANHSTIRISRYGLHLRCVRQHRLRLIAAVVVLTEAGWLLACPHCRDPPPVRGVQVLPPRDHAAVGRARRAPTRRRRRITEQLHLKLQAAPQPPVPRRNPFVFGVARSAESAGRTAAPATTCGASSAPPPAPRRDSIVGIAQARPGRCGPRISAGGITVIVERADFAGDSRSRSDRRHRRRASHVIRGAISEIP